jgi:hypothetical protein
MTQWSLCELRTGVVWAKHEFRAGTGIFTRDTNAEGKYTNTNDDSIWPNFPSIAPPGTHAKVIMKDFRQQNTFVLTSLT